jgi:hypothetical protein
MLSGRRVMVPGVMRENDGGPPRQRDIGSLVGDTARHGGWIRVRSWSRDEIGWPRMLTGRVGPSRGGAEDGSPRLAVVRRLSRQREQSERRVLRLYLRPSQGRIGLANPRPRLAVDVSRAMSAECFMVVAVVPICRGQGEPPRPAAMVRVAVSAPPVGLSAAGPCGDRPSRTD